MSSSSSSSPGSTEGLDRISEDLNRIAESRTTGSIGKNSINTRSRNMVRDSGSRVLPNCNMDAAGREQTSRAISQSLDNDKAISYFLDDLKLPLFNCIDDILPPKTLADRIVHSYFKSVQPLFPIVRTDLFLKQYESIRRSNFGPRPGQK